MIKSRTKTSRDLIFQEIRINLWHIPNLIFELFRLVILFLLWCNKKKALKRSKKTLEFCWRNLKTFSNYCTKLLYVFFSKVLKSRRRPLKGVGVADFDTLRSYFWINWQSWYPKKSCILKNNSSHWIVI